MTCLKQGLRLSQFRLRFEIYVVLNTRIFSLGNFGTTRLDGRDKGSHFSIRSFEWTLVALPLRIFREK